KCEISLVWYLSHGKFTHIRVAGTCRGQKRVSDILELELQAVKSYLIPQFDYFLSSTPLGFCLDDLSIGMFFVCSTRMDSAFTFIMSFDYYVVFTFAVSGGLNRNGLQRLVYLNVWPKGSGTIRRYLKPILMPAPSQEIAMSDLFGCGCSA
ncbi:hypothetical protein STEG23_032966, partial [Scotinomys teguina]